MRNVLALLAVAAAALAALLALALYGPGQTPVTLAGLAVAALLALTAAAVGAWRRVRGLEDELERVGEALERAARGVDEDASAHRDLPPALHAALDAIRDQLRARQFSHDRLDRILSSMNEALFVVDPSGLIERTNAAAGEIIGVNSLALAGQPIESVLIESEPVQHDRRRASRPKEGELKRTDGKLVCVSYTKSEILDEDGNLACAVYAAQNIDEQKRAEQRMQYFARTDPLTKIPNRMEFQHRVQQAIAGAKRGQTYLALLYLDVDRFKDINDTFGHAAGDRSLEMMARRIADVLPETSYAGRLAGDEFCVLLGSPPTIEEIVEAAERAADKLLEAVARPFEVQGEEIFMTTSIGISLFPRDGDNVVDLLRNADAAMFRSKSAGGNCYEYYSPQMQSAAEERLKLKSKLSRALERDELRLHYQPKYRLEDGKVAGAEALVRWNLPDHGLVFPSDFIPLAEETNLILQIGEWVLDRVCADYREWQRIMPSPCRISVNLSLRQLQQQRFIEGVRRAFRKHAVSPTCLELEITETTLMEDTKATIRILEALYGMGLHLAIDDFGTGYSSLSALQQFPISTLKIDRSFIKDLTEEGDNAAIVRTIIQMAHSLKLEVVAEGVESQDQLDFLRRHGCDLAQGHLFGGPMRAEDFCELLVADAEGSGHYQKLFG